MESITVKVKPIRSPGRPYDHFVIYLPHKRKFFVSRPQNVMTGTSIWAVKESNEARKYDTQQEALQEALDKGLGYEGFCIEGVYLATPAALTQSP